MDKQQRSSPGSQASVFRDLRTRNNRRDRVARLLEARRKRRITGMEAQLERWTRHR